MTLDLLLLNKDEGNQGDILFSPQFVSFALAILSFNIHFNISVLLLNKLRVIKINK